LRCSKEKQAYDQTIRWLSELEICNIPIPKILRVGQYSNYAYIILSHVEGNDIGNVYSELTSNEKKRIAKDVIEIQNRVSGLKITIPSGWNWNSFIDEMLVRAYERISVNNFFDVSKIGEVRLLQNELQEYINSVKPIPYLDDISTKNLLIENGKVSGVIDIDWRGIGDVLTFVAMTKVALLNMELDTEYVDYLLEELHPSKVQNRAVIFYCLLYCVDFMGERGMKFLDKVVPVNHEIIDRLNKIYEELMSQWRAL